MKTISIDRWNQAFYEEKMWTLRTTGGTDRNDATPVIMIIYDETEPMVLESNQNHATITDNGICPTLPASMGMGGGYVPMIVYGVTTKGNGDAFISKDVHTTLTGGGGMPGQGYPCIMVAEDEDTDRKKIL